MEVLEERGFIEAKTHGDELREHIESQRPVTCYIGFDPTASSLHVGSLVPIMALAHMQRAGHRPIALVGGGTGLVGDPSGKTEMRKLLTLDDIEENAAGIRAQLSRFIDFDKNAVMLNNADWLASLEYIPFLRDIGRHFSVNRMIKAESYKVRLDSEEGLSFIEFNYMLLQAYDFLRLFDSHGCRLQMGGSDQWGNIVAGIELIRRIRNVTAFGITFPLVTTSSGAKMGKTAKGAVWLDPNRTSPYDYYQFWINTDDRDVRRFLDLFTFLPIGETKEVDRLAGSEINNAKAILAFEATRLAHGDDAAKKAYRAAADMFGARAIPENLMPSSSIPRSSGFGEGEMPSSVIDEKEMETGIPAFKLFYSTGLTPSGSAARRLIQQGGAYINDSRIQAPEYVVTLGDVCEGGLILRAGKKKYHKIEVRR